MQYITGLEVMETNIKNVITPKQSVLACSRAEYSLFFLIGAPGIKDSLYKLALLKQLVKKRQGATFK